MRFPLGYICTNTARFFAVLLCLSLGINITMAQRTLDSSKSESPSPRIDNLAPAPIFISGNPDCKALRDSTNPAFSHIVEDWELKVDFAPNGQYFFNSGQPGVILKGPTDATRSVMATTTNRIVNWSSNKQITAVIVKGGPNANVYPYAPFSFGGNPDGFGLTTPDNGGFGVSHVTFCFGLSLIPSSGGVTLSGRTLTAEGMPIRGATLELWNVTRNEYHTATTSSFGYYVFNDMPAADFYLLTARHGRISFADNVRSFTLNDDLAEVDFFQDH